MAGADDRFELIRQVALIDRFHGGLSRNDIDYLINEVSRLREQVSQLETVYKISTANVVEQLCRAQVAEATIARVEALVGQWDSLARTLDGAPKTTIHSVVQRLRGALASAGVVGGEATPTETPACQHDWFEAVTEQGHHVHSCAVCNEQHHPWGRYGKECDGCDVLPGPPAAVPVPTEEPSDA